MIQLFRRFIGRIEGRKVGEDRDRFGHLSVFDRPAYVDVTEARLAHLRSLNLPIAGKTVIDLGCGIGRLSEFFVELGCDVFCVDGREDNIHQLRKFYPSRKTAIVDLETEDLFKYGIFDIVFCYGILYHLSDPFGFIKRISKICKEMLIIETCITDALDPILYLVKESQADASQALYGVGSRPSPSYITTCLKLAGFSYIYVPRELPNHKQFRYRMVNDHSHLKNGGPIRNIFIASHKDLANDELRQCS